MQRVITDRRSAENKIRELIVELKAMRLTMAAGLVEGTAQETLTDFAFPDGHWTHTVRQLPYHCGAAMSHGKLRVSSTLSRLS